jgi:mono/diheme cytochrome c family protein
MSKDTEKPQSSEEFRDSDSVHVNEIHQRIVSREQLEPEEGFEPTPWWVWTVSVLILFAMGFYLGRYGGSWSTVAHEVEQPSVGTATPAARPAKGDQIFIGVCQTCHQATGLGVPGQYPPLVGSEWVTRDVETPVRIVLYGFEGPVSVKGVAYNNKMPYFHDKLSDTEVAAVVTYIRSTWGNQGSSATTEQVAAIRTQHGIRRPWSAAELTTLRSAPVP